MLEFLYVDDMADACMFLMENYDGEEQVNIETGEEVTIGQLTELVKEDVGFGGKLMFNSTNRMGRPKS